MIIRRALKPQLCGRTCSSRNLSRHNVTPCSIALGSRWLERSYTPQGQGRPHDTRHSSTVAAVVSDLVLETAGTAIPHRLPSHLDLPWCKVHIEDQEQWPSDFDKQFSLEHVLGSGEYGCVWLATKRGCPTERYAVKVMPKTRHDRTPSEHFTYMRREVAVWSICQRSQYVCKFYGAFQDEERVYLVQELCTGGDLRNLIKDGPLTERETACVMRAALDVIATCHSHNLSYGDVKPANFMLMRPTRRNSSSSLSSTSSSSSEFSSGEHAIPPAPATSAPAATAAATAATAASSSLPFSAAALVAAGEEQLDVRATDFGCAQSQRDCVTYKRRVGSPVYMAPELWSQTYNLNVDIWAAGVMMYQLLTCRYPFWDQAAEEIDCGMPMYQIMMAVMSNPVMMKGPRWEGVSRHAKDLISAMLDRNWATRISAADALAHPWFKATLGYTPSVSSLSAAPKPTVHADKAPQTQGLDSCEGGQQSVTQVELQGSTANTAHTAHSAAAAAAIAGRGSSSSSSSSSTSSAAAGAASKGSHHSSSSGRSAAGAVPSVSGAMNAEAGPLNANNVVSRGSAGLITNGSMSLTSPTSSRWLPLDALSDNSIDEAAVLLTRSGAAGA